MVLLIGVVVIYWGSRLPARAAATDCVRAAITTLEQDIGVVQGENAGRDSLLGNNINARDASVEITPNAGGWNRGDQVTCTVRFTINLANSDNTPVGAVGSWEKLVNSPTSGITPAGLQIVESVTMIVDPLKSKWK